MEPVLSSLEEPALGAHHAPGGGYRNPWRDATPPSLREVLRMLSEHRRGLRRAPSPQRGTLPVAAPEIVYPRASAGVVTATWIGHSTVLLQLGALNVITDPVFCQRAFPVQWFGPRRVMDPALSLDALPPLDVVLLSHNHYDHLDKVAVRGIAARHPDISWVVPLGLGATIRRWGARNIVELDWWQRAEMSGLTITATPARHFSARGLGDRNRTLWCGYALSMAGWRGFFAGDTAYHDEFAEVGARCGPFDFVMLPIGAYEPRWFMRAVHIDPDEAVQVYRDLVSAHPDSVLPLMLAVHWGTFRLTTEPIDEPPRRVTTGWVNHGLDAQRLWIASCGETRRVQLAGSRASQGALTRNSPRT